jgi:AAA+ ATPase superfamily predicted ATPase
MSDLLGREFELKQLNQLKNKTISSLVVVTGRRRIGKSALIQAFSKEFPKFYEFQGLPPRPGIETKDQLEHFAMQFAKHFALPKVVFQNWYEALTHLAERCKTGAMLILLDEISWLSKDDKDFPGKLKIVWDTMFSKNPKLILALSGSVASWLEDNILNDAGFVGRVSLVIRLKELQLNHSAKFFKNRFNTTEQLQLLAITGGVPKYLEEIDTHQTVDANIRRLCFTEGGYLYEDFERIFNDIFEKKSTTYKKIVSLLVNQRLNANQIATRLKRTQGGDTSKQLLDLESSGFIRRDYNYSLEKGSQTEISRYRISDNYLRFYLKYIEPNKAKIKQGLFSFQSLSKLLAWDTILGFQFETLIINRIPDLIKPLGIEHEQILSAGPYFQTKTARTSPVQVDLLIHCKPRIIFLCEIKFREQITKSVLTEVKRKQELLKTPKNTAIRPVLIYSGELDPAVKDEDYFDRVLNVAELLK